MIIISTFSKYRISTRRAHQLSVPHLAGRHRVQRPEGPGPGFPAQSRQAEQPAPGPVRRRGDARRQCPVALDEDHRGAQTVRVAAILATLAREDYRYVGIVASDARDVIFLVGMIREFCPDVQVFNLEADLILAHPEYVDKLRGTILASPYPLHVATQQWTPPSWDGTIATCSPTSATRAATTPCSPTLPTPMRPPLTETRSKKARPGEKTRRWMTRLITGRPTHIRATAPATTRPAVWISVVGAHGLWPLAYRVPAKKGGFGEPYEGYVYAARVKAPEEGPEAEAGRALAPASWGWMSTYFGLGAMILVLCWASDVAVGGMKPEGGGWHILYRFWPMHDREAREAQVFYIRCGLWGLGMLFIPVSSDVFAWLTNLAANRPDLAVLAILYAAAVAAVNVIGLGREFEPGEAAGDGRASRQGGRVIWMGLTNGGLGLLAFLATLAIRPSAAFIADWLEVIELHVHVAVLVALVNSIWVRGGRARRRGRRRPPRGGASAGARGRPRPSTRRRPAPRGDSRPRGSGPSWASGRS